MRLHGRTNTTQKPIHLYSSTIEREYHTATHEDRSVSRRTDSTVLGTIMKRSRYLVNTPLITRIRMTHRMIDQYIRWGKETSSSQRIINDIAHFRCARLARLLEAIRPAIRSRTNDIRYRRLSSFS